MLANRKYTPCDSFTEVRRRKELNGTDVGRDS
jgi:hypothetical protein